MKFLIFSSFILSLINCNSIKEKGMNSSSLEQNDLESFAFDGISIDFEFNNDEPSFGDLFLILGYENTDFPYKSLEFKKLNYFNFEQIDDFFGIKNYENYGSDVSIWLYPIIDGKEVYHNDGPLEAVRLTYVIRSNHVKTADLFEKLFYAFKKNLKVTPKVNGTIIKDFKRIKSIIDETIEYCRKDLKVEPGSSEALNIDW